MAFLGQRVILGLGHEAAPLPYVLGRLEAFLEVVDQGADNAILSRPQWANRGSRDGKGSRWIDGAGKANIGIVGGVCAAVAVANLTARSKATSSTLPSPYSSTTPSPALYIGSNPVDFILGGDSQPLLVIKRGDERIAYRRIKRQDSLILIRAFQASICFGKMGAAGHIDARA